MCSLLAFFPGKRRLTNGMLSDLRAAGFYAGQAKVRGWKLNSGYDAFAVETAAIRQMAALRFRSVAGRVREWNTLVDVVVWVVGHVKHDPDAWLLLGKAAVDGLRDAGALRRDRDGVRLMGGVSSGVSRSGDACEPVCGRAMPPDRGDPGFWLLVAKTYCEDNEPAEVLP